MKIKNPNPFGRENLLKSLLGSPFFCYKSLYGRQWKGINLLKVSEVIEPKVRKILGAIPEEIEFVEKLPKTQSGKIMRGLLRVKELGLEVGDLPMLED